MQEVPHDLREKIRFASMFPIAGSTILVATFFLIVSIVFILFNPTIHRLFGIESYRLADYTLENIRIWMSQIRIDPNRYQLVFWFLVAYKIMLIPVYNSFGALASELSRGWSRVGLSILLVSVPISLVAWFTQLWVPQMLMNLSKVDDPYISSAVLVNFANNSFLYRILDAAAYHIAHLGLFIFALLFLRHRLRVVKLFSILYFISFILDILGDIAIFSRCLGGFEWHLWSMGVFAVASLALSRGFIVHGHGVRKSLEKLRQERVL